MRTRGHHITSTTQSPGFGRSQDRRGFLAAAGILGAAAVTWAPPAATPADAATNPIVTAPAPSGGDDTAALQALLEEAQLSGYGTLQLKSGTYHVSGLASKGSFIQPRILGNGMSQTKIIVTGAGHTGVKFVGGSGRASGAVVQDLTLEVGPGATGLEFNGVVGARALRLNFTGQGRALAFSNTKAGDYTEDCVIRDSYFSEFLRTHVEYYRTGGNDSFNGSGFQNCAFNQLATDSAPKIRINAGTKVYNAPFDGSFSLRSSAPFALVEKGALPVHSFGAIRTEGHGNVGHVLVRNLSSTEWFHAGTVNSLTDDTALSTKEGPFRLVHRVQSNRNGTVTALTLPYEETYAAKRGTTTAVHLGQASSSLVSLTLIGSQYEVNYLLHVWRNRTNNAGTVSIIAKPRFFDGARHGRPTFAVRGSHLLVTNSRFPSRGVTATVSVVPLTSTNQPFPLR